ncbi:MICAL-like protein 2, partial [Nibea albiflora]
MSAVKALQQWCRLRCEGYRDVNITNMTTSFRDGLAFCALIHKHRPDLINFDSLKKEDVYENNKLAFKVAEEELGIPALLDAEDMVALRVPDRLSILTYVSQYYNYFHGRSPIGGMGGIKRPAEGPTEESSGKKNQAVTSKVFPSSKPARENSPPPSTNIRPAPSPKQTRNTTQDASVEKSHQMGTLSNKCVSCNKHVHLVQRHLVDGKLYHRSCAKLMSPTAAPLRDLPTNTPVSRFASLLPDSTKTNTNTATHTPSRLGPTWLTEKTSTPSSFSSTFSTSSPSRPASSLSSAAKESPTAFISKPAAPRTTSESTFTTTTSVTRPVAAPRTSVTAAKTHQSKLNFLQTDNSANDEGKKTTTINVDINKGANVTGKVQQVSPGQAVTVVMNVAWQRETNVNTGGEKAKAAAFLSKKLAEENNNDMETPKRETEGVRGRVKLKADKSLLADMYAPDPPNRAPSPAGKSGLRARTPDRGASKPGSASPNTSASEKESPADWRSKLKPISKDAKLSQTTFRKEDIMKELQEIEDNLNELEKRGVELEMRLRSSEEEGEDDSLMDGLMVEWFNLIRNKQVAIRRESELVYIGKTQDLEEQQPSVEQELRRLMDKPAEHLKTSWDRKREEELMAKLVEIVNDRNAIIDGLDEDRLREEEEDEELNKMMMNFS